MLRAIDKWLPGYLASLLRRPRHGGGLRHLVFCVADHFEPFRGGAGSKAARECVARWVDGYPASVAGLCDADGFGPCHTMFYPAEERDAPCLEALASLCERRSAEVEIHLHHRGDTAAGLAAKLSAFRDCLHAEHGLLGTRVDGTPAYGFIHGNWALCNSRPDGDWCGVNEELGVLAETGCFADFTFPSAPSPTQPRTVNGIYRASDSAGRPRSHDRGRAVVLGRGADSAGGRGELMLIQGPLGLRWRQRKCGILPRVENAELTGVNPPSDERVDHWARTAVHVRGRPDVVFVKVHTHGCVEANERMLLGEPMRRAHASLQERYNDGRAWSLHYASAREVYNMVRALEDGMPGSPGEYRDYEIRPPRLRGS